MLLNATADINTYLELATNAGPGVINPETFYTKQLLDTIRFDADKYVYFRLADSMPIGEKADKLLLRRWSPLAAHTTPLTEGVPPMSDKGSVEKYEITANQYGRYMEFTDKVDFQVVDPVIAHYTREYSLVALETLDMLAKETLFSVAQQYYASKVSSGARVAVTTFEGMDMTCTPCMNDLRLIILDLKKALVKPRSNGRFHVIGSPEFYYDMISDPVVEKYMTFNQTTKTMYDDGKLVPMFEMEFYEAYNVPQHGQFIKNSAPACRMLAADGATLSTIDATTVIKTGEEDLVYGTIAASYMKDSRTGDDASWIPAHLDFNIDAYTAAGCDGEGLTELKVHHILIVGKDALTRTGLKGEDSARMYVKPKGSSGVLDPIDQRQSIGFKINSVGFGSTRLEAIADYMCIPSMAN
jgi:N4-gp56 family major capsid protein